MNKNIIKEVFNKNINKEKIYSNIIKKKNKNNYFKIILIPVSLIIITVFSLYFKQNNEFSSNNSITIIKINEKNITSDEEHATPFPHDVKTVDYNDNDFSLDVLKNVKIPADLFYSLYHIYYIKDVVDSSKYDDISNNKYNNIHSYDFRYSNQIDRHIKISLSKDYIPFRDYIIGENGNKSLINGKKVEIWKYNNEYQVTFKYLDYNFDIETSNISEEELISLLDSIIR